MIGRTLYAVTAVIGLFLQPTYAGREGGCSIGCQGNACSSDGTCTGGCAQGYRDFDCSHCADGFYRENSLCRPCSVGCQYKNCDTLDGYCVCSEQFTGSRCDRCADGYYEQGRGVCFKCTVDCVTCSSRTRCTSCLKGKYGPSCSIPCPVGCRGGRCDMDGRCTDGCMFEYEGEYCMQCKGNKWGNGCSNNCPVNCTRCLSDLACSICKVGYYGPTCGQMCSHGCVGECGKVTGACTSCRSGFSGDMCCIHNDRCRVCDSHTECEECVAGYYGAECEHQCVPNCLSCQSDMYCDVCEDGLYGAECEIECPEGCVTCTAMDKCGRCLDGLFGPSCRKRCLDNCKLCTNATVCVTCSEGWYGVSCEHQCRGCAGGVCERNNGTCLLGCAEGFSGVNCQNSAVPGTVPSVFLVSLFILAVAVTGR